MEQEIEDYTLIVFLCSNIYYVLYVMDFGCIWSTPSNVQFLIRKNIIVSSNIILANIKKNLFTF